MLKWGGLDKTTELVRNREIKFHDPFPLPLTSSYIKNFSTRNILKEGCQLRRWMDCSISLYHYSSIEGKWDCYFPLKLSEKRSKVTATKSTVAYSSHTCWMPLSLRVLYNDPAPHNATRRESNSFLEHSVFLEFGRKEMWNDYCGPVDTMRGGLKKAC